ncbi:MAG: hypothetical protein ACD_7C00153G0009 [uncultured bacterium]|nr:MAG: hypothetical protein ACD_7C00153G0009 [uncultured bacterium]KKP68215.1 MAG: hypothetical protein UR66_C0007G0022 [Candidatus Moranbacteria bacterium GW2011_GWE1_35_17]KKP72928.1 MAG: hypothetical protein UR65_C0010G0007 [Candidatus Moranbacteria bacterium GW2011_GWE2_35_164]KKP83278.1 MAG: hypothetical protein UR82_C0023G0007 [Candidatus Moranbacteria bacterium GW2011_GWF1_35_5]KKP85264.1 MAG: hypothetical protein UR83_C0002G0004 [Candidatus Moranbacteria bacterium GW2011_GWF2_35_54]
MKIDFTKEQYRNLMTMISIADGVVGILGDVIPEKDYKKLSGKMEELETYLLGYASDFDCNEFLDEDFYEDKILPIVSDFEEYSTHDNLSNDLAWRDFRREHTQEELDNMAKENGGYFGVALYDYEKKYWDEFEKNGYDRLEINK